MVLFRLKRFYLFYTLSIFLLSLSVFNLYFYNKVLPGVYLGDDSVSYLNKEQFLKKYAYLKNENNIKVLLNTGDFFELPLTQVDFSYDLDSTYQQIFLVGRDSFFSPYIHYVNFILGNTVHKYFIYSYNEDTLNVLISSISAKYYPEVGNAYFYIDKQGSLNIKDASFGKDLDASYFRESLINAFKNGSTKIELTLKDFKPSIYASDLVSLKPKLEKILNIPFKISFENSLYELPNDRFLKLLDFSKNESGDLHIVLNKEELQNLTVELSNKYNVTPRGTLLKINGDTIDFKPPLQGISVLQDELYNNLKSSILKALDATSSEIIVQVPFTRINPPKTQNDYGITELIAEGVSYFKGSSYNRVRNIVTASSKIKGTLVAPGEEFSFNKAVGPITLDAGFNQAYIISKGRTTLGTGGGVCQVSTTVFRAALNAGLPIVKRTSHAYRVSYYEQKAPIGLDATIYQPSVDFVFKNDTKNYILVYTELDERESRLSVKIYGTKDGRTVTITKPSYKNPIPPPPARYIDDPTLPKGSLVQLEYPAWGGLVTYTRIVKDKDGNVMYKDDFKNYYTPWPAVYKRGIKE